jgi:hypothetical protein
MTLRHIERTVSMALRAYIMTYSVIRSDRLSTNIILTLYILQIKSVMAYAYPT